MELFERDVNGQHFVYLLDEIPEDFGFKSLNTDHTLVALLEPVNGVQALKLDGRLEGASLQGLFPLEPHQCQALAAALNDHIPNDRKGD